MATVTKRIGTIGTAQEDRIGWHDAGYDGCRTARHNVDRMTPVLDEIAKFDGCNGTQGPDWDIRNCAYGFDN